MHKDKPLAAEGFTSYRCKTPYGYVMIGATDDEDAYREAQRSTDFAKRENLEVWNGQKYVPIQQPVAEAAE